MPKEDFAQPMNSVDRPTHCQTGEVATDGTEEGILRPCNFTLPDGHWCLCLAIPAPCSSGHNPALLAVTPDVSRIKVIPVVTSAFALWHGMLHLMCHGSLVIAFSPVESSPHLFERDAVSGPSGRKRAM